MVEVSTSILTLKKEDILGAIYNLEVAKTDYFHIDVMDGKFVEQDTIETMHEYSNNIKQISNLPLDVHLMVEDVKTYIDSFVPYNPNIITFHFEACKDKEEVLELIKYIKENNIKARNIYKTKYKGRRDIRISTIHSPSINNDGRTWLWWAEINT